MDNESIPDEPTLDANRTIEDEDLTGTTAFPDKQNVSSPAQTLSPPVEAQISTRTTLTPTRQRNVRPIVLYAVFLLIGIVLGVVGMLLFLLTIGGTKSPVSVAPTSVASGNITVHADQSIITPLLQNSVQQIALP